MLKIIEKSIGFLTHPFKDSTNIYTDDYSKYEKYLSEEKYLSIKAEINRRNNKPTILTNDNVKQGRVRISILFDNEYHLLRKQGFAKKKKDNILISTDRLDPKLYSNEVIDIIIKLIKKDYVQILYKNESLNTSRITQLFNGKSSNIKKVDDDITNFIISSHSASIEESQSYSNEGELITHKAKFWLNYNLDNTSELKKSITSKRCSFQKLMNN